MVLLAAQAEHFAHLSESGSYTVVAELLRQLGQAQIARHDETARPVHIARVDDLVDDPDDELGMLLDSKVVYPQDR